MTKIKIVSGTRCLKSDPTPIESKKHQTAVSDVTVAGYKGYKYANKCDRKNRTGAKTIRDLI